MAWQSWRRAGLGWLAALGCAPSDLALDTRGAGSDGCAGLAEPAPVQRGADGSSVSGVVSLVQDRADEAPGFYLQASEADAARLGQVALFVAFAGAPPPGTRLVAHGQLRQHEGLWSLDGVERLDECGPAELRVPSLELPGLAPDESELEGAFVRLRASWALLDLGGLASGRLTLSPRGRRYAPGHELGADAAPPADDWTLILPAAPPDTVAPARFDSHFDELSGVLHVAGSARSLRVAAAPDWAEAPPPPRRVPGSTLRVVGLNLDNYFSEPGGLGARDAAELERQRAKLCAALSALDADVLGLTELGNDGSRSLEHLLAGLASAEYTLLEQPAPAGPTLRAGIAYRAGRLAPRGAAWFDAAPGLARPFVFQSFEGESGRFTLALAHLKSKLCAGQAALEPLSGCGADTRRSEVERLLERLGEIGSRLPGEPLLVLGDFNADSGEDALAPLAAAGLVDVLGALPAAQRYSYVFEGRASLLDHAFANAALAEAVRGSALWHINADEPSLRSYSHAAAQGIPPDARRSSDHDPVLVDLAL